MKFDERISTETESQLEGSSNRWGLDPNDIREAFPMTSTAMQQVVALFRESCEDRIGRIREALLREDRVELSRNTHALKGSLGMFASPQTLELVTNLENNVREGSYTQAFDWLIKLNYAIESLQPSLDCLLFGTS